MKIDDQEILDFVAKIFDVETSSINMETSIYNFPKWDSLNHIKLIVNLEEFYELTLSPIEINEISSIQDICNVVNNKFIQ